MSNMRQLLQKVQRQVSTDEGIRNWEQRTTASATGVEGSSPAFFISNPELPRARRSRAVAESVLDLHLPSLRDAPEATRSRLLLQKLRLASYVFDFNSEEPDTPLQTKRKEVKRACLLELVNYLTVVKPALEEHELEVVFEMLSFNLFRPLPPSTLDLTGVFNPEEDEPQSEPTWPHLQVVYEFLLRLASSKDTPMGRLDRFFSKSFVSSLIALFDSEDPRERDYLKTILHRIYGNFMNLRPLIRKIINNVFYEYIYETDRHNGIAELLEILGSIINGFALPLKEMHKVFLAKVLLPLHKATYVSTFHPQLSYCMSQFLEKDATLAPTIVLALLKYWPVTCSKKELMFLNELEEVLERVSPQNLGESEVPLFQQVARCINSSHFQVSERAIYILNNDVILRFITNNREVLVPILARALYFNTHSSQQEYNSRRRRSTEIDPSKARLQPPEQGKLQRSRPGSSSGTLKPASSDNVKKDDELDFLQHIEVKPRWERLGHWNASIVELTTDILKLFSEMDSTMMLHCRQRYENEMARHLESLRQRKTTWVILENKKQKEHSIGKENSNRSSGGASTSGKRELREDEEEALYQQPKTVTAYSAGGVLMRLDANSREKLGTKSSG
eukprot:gb/GEZN01003600.1/.p1 GENE.gb/GEZN01003600.1/~~gb/GEZN01003600.1/.p1  ORF type:complete len:620 (-),score=69.21 gb/GEZN01003600.1/:105-1964(-)